MTTHKKVDFEKDLKGQSVLVAGHVHTDEVPSAHHLLGTIATNDKAAYGPFTTGATYEFTFFDNADLEDGQAPNVYVAAGISTIADAPAADAMLLPTSQIPVWQYRFLGKNEAEAAQTHIAFRTPNGAKTVAIFARRIR